MRPILVKQAVILMVASFAMAIPKTYLDQDFLASLGPVSFSYTVIAITCAIIGFIAYKVWCGKNWARVTLAVLFVLGLYPSIQLIPVTFIRSTLIGSLSVIQIFGQMFAIVMLYLPESNKWYREIKEQKNA